jgi:hypothetical protein
VLTVFYRRFYILLFLIWIGAVGSLFVLSVWGDFDAFIRDFNLQTARMENGTDSEMNSTGAFIRAAEEDGTAIRREVVHDVHKVEQDVQHFFGDNTTAKAGADPIKKEIQEDLAAKSTPKQPEERGAVETVGVLDKLEFTHDDGQFLARLQTSREVGRVTYFWLYNPSKLVVDLRGKWRYSVHRLTDFNSGFVGQVVLGRHTDRLRLVFNFRDRDAKKGPAPKLIRTPRGLDVVVASPPEASPEK